MQPDRRQPERMPHGKQSKTGTRPVISSRSRRPLTRTHSLLPPSLLRLQHRLISWPVGSFSKWRCFFLFFFSGVGLVLAVVVSAAFGLGGVWSRRRLVSVEFVLGGGCFCWCLVSVEFVCFAWLARFYESGSFLCPRTTVLEYWYSSLG
jgi:hypothetical protein